MRFIIATTVILFAASAALADERPYLEGRFDLDISKSNWESENTSFTGGFWVFERDDGKTRKGYGVQYSAAFGRPLVYHFDNTPYDGTFHWLNDWYKGSETYVDDHTFKSSWEIHRGETPTKGEQTCKINEARDVIRCEGKDFVEVWAKTEK